ncbi:dihydrofolate reductase family protein [Actinoplanes sp. KI2]|uniref:dihydrofolate reductase family protein n=1 Tax=Actinoplanes sp. KI2 TaxID=2983315 RepID=UPI0021D59F13|nr:dihydrofolate reductase family protein [Actinoplanes sp. KI2]MCU7727882.1 dihydrofolate reductase family protein [Actinoplanes sp. KI2]
MSVIYLAFTTLDGIVTDPDGAEGTPAGGWMFQFGPEAVAGDKFRLGPLFDSGVMLLGRRTWQAFGRLWPTRDDPFSRRMNAIPKLVASRTLTDASAWANSRLVEGDVVDTVKRESRDVVVTGSRGLAHLLMAHDLIDEYRLITFPIVLGAGKHLFPSAERPTTLQLREIEQVGPAVYARYGRSSSESR